jgi:sec-independent protein translocase protein TatA
MFSPGPMEMVIVGLIALLLFGNRLPKVMRSLGQGITEFKKGVRGIQDEIEESVTKPIPAPDPKTLS